MYFSKSRYCSLCQCPKSVWLKKFKPDEYEVDESVKARMDNGNVVGDFAMGLFGDYVEVTATKENGALDLSKMIAKTKECIASGVQNICEASFDFCGLYCAVDILRKDGDGYSIYEVKSATDIKAVYIYDVSYQKYVLEKCGVNVKHTYLVYINNEYVRGKELDIKQVFKVRNVDELVAQEYGNVEGLLQGAEELLADEQEPRIDISINCFAPYKCGFWKYCSQHLPKPSVFDMYRLPKPKAFECYEQGVVSFEDSRARGGIFPTKSTSKLTSICMIAECMRTRTASSSFLPRSLIRCTFWTLKQCNPSFRRLRACDRISKSRFNIPCIISRVKAVRSNTKSSWQCPAKIHSAPLLKALCEISPWTYARLPTTRLLSARA